MVHPLQMQCSRDHDNGIKMIIYNIPSASWSGGDSESYNQSLSSPAAKIPVAWRASDDHFMIATAQGRGNVKRHSTCIILQAVNFLILCILRF